MNSSTEPVALPHPGKLLLIEPLDYPNPYDYRSAHRHDYFEIILVKSGTGSQIIDFCPYEITAGKLFTVYPGQVHLMNRNDAQGLLIQFRKDLFEVIFPVKHHQLHFPEPEFTLEPKVFDMLYTMTQNMMDLVLTPQLSPLSIHKAYSYLEIILITLIEIHDQKSSGQYNKLTIQFLALLTQHIKSKKKVSDYCQMLNCSPGKLNAACKLSLGKGALALIHEETLLEIRRLLLLNQLSLKEIAFELNFDSQANFSTFIKSHTGQTASQLQEAIVNF